MVKNLNTKFTINNWFLGPVKLSKKGDLDKYK